MDSIPVFILCIIGLFEPAMQSDNLFQNSKNELNEFDKITGLSSSVQNYCNPFQNIKVNEERNIKIESIKSLKLNRVFVITRHGDRAPLKPIVNLTSISVDPIKYSNENIQPFIKKFFTDTKTKFRQIKRIGRKSLHERANAQHLEPGQLTKNGFIQHLTLGSVLGKYYRTKMRIKANEIKAISTNTPRTHQSAIAFLYGFLRPESDSDFRSFPEITTINSTSVAVGAFLCFGCSEKCPSYPKLKESIKQIDDEIISSQKQIQLIMEKAKSILSNNQAEFKKYKTPFHVFDGLSAYFCHNQALPCKDQLCVTWKELNQLKDAIDFEMRKLDNSEPYKKLSLLKIYVFLNALFKNMADTHSKIKLTLYSAHDITIQPVATALDFFDGLIPPYSSRLIFETYITENNIKDNNPFVRIIFNGKDVTHLTGFCKWNPSLCLSHGFDKQISLIKLNILHEYIQDEFRYYFHTYDRSKACNS